MPQETKHEKACLNSYWISEEGMFNLNTLRYDDEIQTIQCKSCVLQIINQQRKSQDRQLLKFKTVIYLLIYFIVV